MTIVIANNSPRVSYTVAADATQTSFAVSFEFFADADLNFIVDGTTKTLTTHYTVSGGDGSTGTITTTSGNTVTGISGGSTVVITRDIALERITDFPAQGSFQIASLNTELDRFTAIAADLNDKAGRSLQLTDYDTAVSLTLPAVDTRKGKVLAFNASTGAVEAGPSTSDVQTVSANAASVALLGTSDAVSDMNALSAAAVLTDMDLLATTAVIADMNLLATSAVIEDMGLLATSAVIEDMGLLGTSANVTAMGVLGTSANVTAMSALSDSAVLADMALLGTSAVIADMALLATSDVISDLNTLATSDIVTDLNVLATSDIVSDMNALATSDIVSDMNALATSDIISDLNALATSDIISDMNTLSASAVIADMASLAGSGANPNITSVTASGTIAFGSLSDGTVTITDIADEDNMSSNSAVKLATQQSIKAYVDANAGLSLIDEDNMASNSATRPPSQQSTKAYVDATTTIANAALPKAGGTMTGVLTANGGAVFNEAGADVDFRVESDTITHALFVQGSDGLVGIGTSSPAGILNVSGTAGDAMPATSGSTQSAGLITRLQQGGGIGSVMDIGGNGGSGSWIQVTESGNLAANYKLLLNPNGGNVGIGTTAPTATLTVEGNAVAKTDTDTSNTGSVTLNFTTNQNFVLTLTGNVTLANPTTEVVGQSGFITLIQDGTGGRTLSLGTDYETAGGAGITLTATASATDIVPYVVSAAGRILLGAPQLAFS